MGDRGVEARAGDLPQTRVSVIVPMKNMERYVHDALVSVLATPRADLEVVVVDDGCTDNSVSIVKSINDPRIRLVTGPCRGFSASFNAGLAASRGDIVMECDADDLYVAGRIDRQVEWLDEHSGCDAVCGRFSTVSSTGKLVANLYEEFGKPFFENISLELRGGVVRTHLCTFAIRRKVFDLVGGLREYFESGSDTDFQLRMGEQCQVDFIPEQFYLYRLHDRSITHMQSNVRRDYFGNAAFVFQGERQATGKDSLEMGRAPIPPGVGGKRTTAQQHVQSMLIGRSWLEIRRGQFGKGTRTCLQSLMVWPWSGMAWLSAAKVIGHAVIRRRSS